MSEQRFMDIYMVLKRCKNLQVAFPFDPPLMVTVRTPSPKRKMQEIEIKENRYKNLLLTKNEARIQCCLTP